MSQEIVATGGAKTRDAANAIVPTLCQKMKCVDLPHVNDRLPGTRGLLVQVTLDTARGMTTGISILSLLALFTLKVEVERLRVPIQSGS